MEERKKAGIGYMLDYALYDDEIMRMIYMVRG